MNFDAFGHVAYKIVNAEVKQWPFPHIYVEDVFPPDFYALMLSDLPAPEAYSGGTSNYHGRKFSQDYPPALEFMRSPEFTSVAKTPFIREIKNRFGSFDFSHYTDLRLIRDQQNYSIGPHTDAPWKVLSYLFYLPETLRLEPYGTSIYLSRDPKFYCHGGPHHPFDNFVKIATAPFRPNSLFAFFKTEKSFHGVDPITIACQRDLLLWNLYDKALRDGTTSG